MSPFIWQDVDGDHLTVPAGSKITLWMGVSEQIRETLTAFIHAQTTTITIDETTVDVSDAWPTPKRRPQGDWATFITYSTGITLGAGQSLTAVWVTTLAYPVPEMFGPAADGPSRKLGLDTDSATFTCTVTAA